MGQRMRMGLQMLIARRMLMDPRTAGVPRRNGARCSMPNSWGITVMFIQWASGKLVNGSFRQARSPLLSADTDACPIGQGRYDCEDGADGRIRH